MSHNGGKDKYMIIAFTGLDGKELFIDYYKIKVVDVDHVSGYATIVLDADLAFKVMLTEDTIILLEHLRTKAKEASEILKGGSPFGISAGGKSKQRRKRAVDLNVKLAQNKQRADEEKAKKRLDPKEPNI